MFLRSFILALIVGTGVQAQQHTPESLVLELAPGAAGPMVQTLKSQNALVFDAKQPLPTVFDFPSANVTVSFEEGSHLLTVEGMTALRTVSYALTDQRLETQKFQVAGHVVLPDDPNSATRLSALRADAVVEHLIAYYSIPPERLVSVGYGATAPADPSSMASPLNSRIQFINILAD